MVRNLASSADCGGGSAASPRSRDARLAARICPSLAALSLSAGGIRTAGRLSAVGAGTGTVGLSLKRRVFFLSLVPPRIRNVTSGLCDLVAVSVEEGTLSSGSGWSAGAEGLVGMLILLGIRGVPALPFDGFMTTRGPFLRDLLVETIVCGSTFAEPLRLPGEGKPGFISPSPWARFFLIASCLFFIPAFLALIVSFSSRLSFESKAIMTCSFDS